VSTGDPCIWVDENDYHATGCDNDFTYTSDGIEANGFKFCPYCGKRIGTPVAEALEKKP
jgi:hypothetical protein